MKPQFPFGRLLAIAALTLPSWTVSPAAAADETEKKNYDPHITYLFPAGGQQGKTVEAMIRGRGLEGATEARISGPGVTAKVLAIEEPSTKLAQRSANRQDSSDNPNVVRLAITVAPDAVLGERDCRLVTPKGVTNRFRFIVGQIPEVNEIEPDPKTAKPEDEIQTIESLPVVVNGQVFQGDRDTFRFAAKAGETIVCEVKGRDLLPYVADAVPGWLQASLALLDEAGNEVAYVDDYRFNPDPVLIYTVPKDGLYIARVRDVLYRGREDLVYRLSIGQLPFITHVFPLGGKRGTDTKVELFGANLPEASMTVSLPADAPDLRSVSANRDGIASNEHRFATGDTPEAMEVEPNDAKEQAHKLHWPVVVNGRIDTPGDVDLFSIAVAEKQRVIVDVWARRLGSPMDSILTVLDANGRELIANDDTVDNGSPLITHHSDSRVAYTFPAAGDYTLRVQDVQGQGGQEYAYRLRVTPPERDYTLQVTPDNPRMCRGATGMVTVRALRKVDFGTQIDLALANLPEGCVVSHAVIPAWQNETRVTLTMPEGAPLGPISPTITGTAKVGEQSIVRQAVPAEAIMQAFIYWHNLPTKDFLPSITEPGPCRLSSNVPATEVKQVPLGGSLPVKVTVRRKEGVTGAIRLAADKPPRGITVKGATIAADANEATVTITAANPLKAGFQQNIIVTGTVKIGKDNVTCVAPAIPIEVIAPPAAE